MSKRMFNALAAASLAGLAMSLCGCANIHNGFMALKPTPATTAQAAPEVDATPPIRTVRTGAKRSRPVVQSEADEPAVRTAAIPTPAQIFDFHTSRSAMEEWRTPFVIAENDGPLTYYVRKSASELREFKAGLRTREAQGGDAKLCGEAQVVAGNPRCLPQARKSRAAAISGAAGEGADAR